jgi:hypothetical protein
MAMQCEVIEDFLCRQEEYISSIRQTQPDPVSAATSTPKGKERAQSPTIKPKPADTRGVSQSLASSS